jgi:hypothetical protein
MKNRLIASFLLGGLVLAGSLTAQTAAAPALKFPQASPPATVKQQVGITDIELTYSRPSVKGRKIFGGLVPYGEVWRTGANSATKISFSTPVKVGGTEIPAGTYELFTIPNATEWTIIFHKNMSQWGAYTYDQKNDVARVTVKATESTSVVETFAIGFSSVTEDSAVLNFAWDKARASVKINIDTKGMLVPQIEAAMANPESAKKFAVAAAMFYYENDLDLKKAAAWMDAGLASQPNAFWLIYRKGLILEKAGDKAGAKAAAEQSLALAEQDKREGIKKEYIGLNKALLERLK